MAHAKNEVIIDRPIEEVFAYIANGENNAHWRGGFSRSSGRRITAG
jgi:hypothetical protein